MAGWEEQWARIERWYRLFRQTNDGRTHDRESDYYQDEVYAFFQNAHHFKDWLKNDPEVAGPTGDVETFIDRSANLRLCADLCNGSKHLKLKYPRASADAAIGKRDFRVGLSDPPSISATYVVESAGTSHDAFELATACIHEWRMYLEAKSLL